MQWNRLKSPLFFMLFGSAAALLRTRTSWSIRATPFRVEAVSNPARSLLSESHIDLYKTAGPKGFKAIWRCLREGVDPTSSNASAVGGGGATKQHQHRHQNQPTPLLHEAVSVLGHYACIDDVATVVHETACGDGTRKLLFRLRDGLEVEAVIIPPLPPNKPPPLPLGGHGSNRHEAGDEAAAAVGMMALATPVPPAAANARARSTLCVSSQVGCRMGCAFCATGRMGLLRNLTSDEILAQAFAARARVAADPDLPPLTNVVFMGMGEPADNAEAVREAVACLTDRDRFGFAAKSVVVSTVAPSPSAFHRLLFGCPAPAVESEGAGRLPTGKELARPSTTAVAADNDDGDDATAADDDAAAAAAAAAADPAEGSAAEAPPGGGPDHGPMLAWSLHAADPGLRQQLVPTATHSPAALRDGLVAALLARPDPRRRRVLVEVVLIAGVNDDPGRDARALAAFVAPLEAACRDPNRQSKRTGVLVNLIPYNGGGGEGGVAEEEARAGGEAEASPSWTVHGDAHQAGGSPMATPFFPERAVPHYSHFRRPTRAAVEAFQAELRCAGVWTSVRATRGDDRASACGQLATERMKQGAWKGGYFSSGP